MIARRDFLMKTVPYFFLPRMRHQEDGTWAVRKAEETDAAYKIGFIQTPQSFYNPDLFQFNLYAEHNIPNEQDFFSREINVMRNSTNAVAYTGSNTVISRQALDEIGGFPTDTITEDFETGIKIQAKRVHHVFDAGTAGQRPCPDQHPQYGHPARALGARCDSVHPQHEADHEQGTLPERAHQLSAVLFVLVVVRTQTRVYVCAEHVCALQPADRQHDLLADPRDLGPAVPVLQPGRTVPVQRHA